MKRKEYGDIWLTTQDYGYIVIESCDQEVVIYDRDTAINIARAILRHFEEEKK